MRSMWTLANSSQESGTPTGAVGTSLSGLALLYFSIDSIRRSISRTLSVYESRRFRSRLSSPFLRRTSSVDTTSRTLRLSFRRAARSSAEPPVPNSCSNAIRGLYVIGSGVVGEDQLIVFMYTQLYIQPQEPVMSSFSVQSWIDGIGVSW